MALNPTDKPRMKGTVRGRDSRDRSLNTKLTQAELVAVEAAAQADGRAVGEWMREVVLKEIRSASGGLRTEHVMAEIISLQQFLTNALYPLVCGTQMTAEQYRELMRSVKTNKRRAAREAIAQCLATDEEENHG
jgi:prophage antirepressor-like protein